MIVDRISISDNYKLMKRFENVEHTNPFELLFLLLSTIAVFLVVILLQNRLVDIGFLKFVLALIIAGFYFIYFKRKFIVKKTDFELTSDKLKWNSKSLDFNSIEYYKIHWMRGAGIKFRLKNGKTVRLSSNDNFCDSRDFVMLCETIDSKLINYDSGRIERKQSFFETKWGFYTAILFTTLFIIITLYRLHNNLEFNKVNIVLIVFNLGTIWTGVRLRKNMLKK